MKERDDYVIDYQLNEEPAADGSPSGVEAESENDDEKEPFDPEQVSIDSKKISMDAIIRRMLQDKIRLAPAFQRKVIWDKGKKSRLIESLMLKIPIPIFYVAADERGNWDVVDGLQRLTTLKDFILGDKYIETGNDDYRGYGFFLTELEFWGDKFNGKTFKELPDILQNRILETEFTFSIINPGNPEQVKRNIFKRINTGGMPLTPQEIRHALYQGKSTKLLAELIETKEFKTATYESIDDSRMAARETVLRFLVFSIRNCDSYRKPDMDTFLSDTMRLINIMPEMKKEDIEKIFKPQLLIPDIRFKAIEILKERFINAMQRAHKLFGLHTFRKSHSDNRRAPINKTLFEVWGNLLADLSDKQFETLLSNSEDFLKEYNDLLDTKEFEVIVSRDSWKPPKVKERYSLLGSMVNKYSNQ